MKYVDTPPILAILFSKLQTPPTFECNSKRPPPNWLSFIYTPPKIGENGLQPPPQKKYTPPPPLDVFDIFPYCRHICWISFFVQLSELVFF